MRIVLYKNSFLANVISLNGTIFGVVTIYMLYGNYITITEAIFPIILSILSFWVAKKISENKAEKTWWKSIIEKVPKSEIAASAQNMMKVYNASPKKSRTYKRLKKLNPEILDTLDIDLSEIGMWNKLKLKKSSKESKNKEKKGNGIIKKKLIGLLGSIVAITVALFSSRLESGLESLFQSKFDKYEDQKYSINVEGSWEHYDRNTTETKTKLLKNIDLTDEEIEIVKYIPSYYVLKYDFNVDGTYKEYYDKDKSFDEAEKFFNEVFEKIYKNRSEVSDYYKKQFKLDVKKMSLKEFKEAMAKLYRVKDYEALLPHLIDIAYKDDAYEEILDEGNYTVDANKIYTKNGSTYITYRITDEGRLVLKYSNNEKIFKRVD